MGPRLGPALIETQSAVEDELPTQVQVQSSQEGWKTRSFR